MRDRLAIVMTKVHAWLKPGGRFVIHTSPTLGYMLFGQYVARTLSFSAARTRSASRPSLGNSGRAATVAFNPCEPQAPLGTLSGAHGLGGVQLAGWPRKESPRANWGHTPSRASHLRLRSEAALTMSERNPVRVHHVTAVETSNYYLNSLADTLHPTHAKLLAVTLGHGGGFVDDLRRRGVDARALGCGSRLSLPLAAIRIATVAARRGFSHSRTSSGPPLSVLSSAASVGGH